MLAYWLLTISLVLVGVPSFMSQEHNEIQIIGIFWHCPLNTSSGDIAVESNKEQISRNVSQWINKTMTELFQEVAKYQVPVNFYTEFTICKSRQNLLHLMTDLLLDNNTNYFPWKYEKCANRVYDKTYVWQNGRSIILSYLPDELTQMLVTITSSFNIKVRSYSNKSQINSVSNLYFYPQSPDFGFSTIATFVETLKVAKYVTILNVHENINGESQELQILSERLFEYLSNLDNFCVNLINDTGILPPKELVDSFLVQESLVIILGYNQRAYDLLKEIEYSGIVAPKSFNHRTWINYPGDPLNKLVQQSFGKYPQLPGLFTIDHHRLLLTSLNPGVPYSDEYDIKLDIIGILTEFYYAIQKNRIGISHECYVHYLWQNFLNANRGLFEGYTSTMVTMNQVRTRMYEWPLDNTSWKQTDLKCPGKKSCAKGYENRFGIYTNMNFSQFKGWFCSTCRKGYYKYTIGNSSCRKCPLPMISNNDRISCQDPYQNKDLSLEEKRVVIVLSGCCAGIFLSSIVIVVFITHWKTPIVKSSDPTLFSLEMFKIVTLFALIPSLFLSEASYWKCVVRPIVIGLLQSLHLGLMVTKTYKVHQIFASNYRLNRTDFAKVSASQVFVILIFLLINSLLLLTLFKTQTVTVETILHKDLLIRKTYCSSDAFIVQQLPFHFLLLVLCGYQAYRCRNLPSVYNESVKFLYNVFITCVLFSMMVMLYYTQKDPVDRQVALMMVLGIINSVSLMIHFSPKCFIILFRSHTNTKQAFRQNLRHSFEKSMCMEPIQHRFGHHTK
ncbi:uncharacterized protein [Clytia hemisphaerica]|uniref:uncharacterized protein n=1 Tax=Clytia hemisphaerica TaxID=252671 RepID=UPI0034D5D7C2